MTEIGERNLLGGWLDKGIFCGKGIKQRDGKGKVNADRKFGEFEMEVLYKRRIC